MKTYVIKPLGYLLLLLMFLYFNPVTAQNQRDPKIPVEFFAGHENVYFQLVMKKSIHPEGKFNFFGLTAYTADYENDPMENRLITITQLSYDIGKGFGFMAGGDMNSFSGFAPVMGPQHTFANKEWLAVTVTSFFMNEPKDFKIFGLYEYKPALSPHWKLYNRLQFIYNHSLKYGDHNKSYIYLRAGVQKDATIFGLAANMNWSGPQKNFAHNIGGFIRYEFD